MQSCLCLSRVGKPLLRNSRRPWGRYSGGICALPSLWPNNSRFSHIAQPKLRDGPQEELQTVDLDISRSTHEHQFVAAPPRTAIKPRDGISVRKVHAYKKQEKDRTRERQRYQAGNTSPQNIKAQTVDAPPKSSHPDALAITAKADDPPETSFPPLKRDGENFEDLENYEWSPGVVLAKILETRDQPEREKLWLYIRERSSFRSLPIITIHYLLRSSVPRTAWTRHDQIFHKKAHRILYSRGMTWLDVSNWAWILSGRTSDDMADRLVSGPSDQPSFILLEILRRDISKVKSLEMLLDYSRNQILRLGESPRSSMPESQPGTTKDMNEISKPQVSVSPWKDDHRTVAKPGNFRIEENAFAVLISRLLYQTRRIWPSAMVDVAHMTAQYLYSISASSVGSPEFSESRIFARLCKINNYFLRLLALPSSLKPLQSMAYNWSAQKVLLELAGQFEPPLRLDHASYRAVIQVLAASKKSTRETKSAIFRNRSWPPWRVEQDGMDARRSQDDDLSRVISAIIRSKESGYTQDSQLSIFGGLDTDGTPTIHTRKLLKWRSLRSFPRARDCHNDEVKLWAARIEATRDVHEAWGAFTEFHRKGGKANLSMYFAMFQKLNYESRRSGLESDIQGTPGDGREVFPVLDDNFSDFYRTRLQPPTLQNLYQEMRAAGIRPSGRSLSFLLRHARTIDEGLQYLLDSGLDKQVVAYLANGGESQVLADVVAQMSEQTLTDFISLVCRFAPQLVKGSDSELQIVEHVKKRGSSLAHTPVWTIREAGVQKYHHSRLGRPLHHAAFLLKSCQPKFRPAWYALFKSLSRRNIVLLARHLAIDPEKTCENHEQAWRIARAALEEFHNCGLELDPEGFHHICQTFARYAESAFHTSERHRTNLIETSQIIKAEYAKLTDGSKELPYGTSRLWHILEGVHLHAYVRAMGLIGDYAAIISLLEWMVKNHEVLDALALQSTNGQRMLRQTVVATKVFCDGTEYAVASAQALVQQVDSWGGWPSQEDVKNYLDGGNDQLLGAVADPDDDDEGDWEEEDAEAQIAV